MGKWWLCGVSAAVLVVSVSLLFGLSAKTPATATSHSAPAKTTVTTRDVYGTLGVWNGQLALFCGENTPDTVYDVWVNTLPLEEQQRLAAGIVAPTRAAFLTLLQEYTG